MKGCVRVGPGVIRGGRENQKPVDDFYNQVSIGDVGYLLGNGAFMRLFNVTLPWDDPSNSLLQVPEEYEHLELGYLNNVHSSETCEREYCSHVSKVDNNYANTHAEAMGQMYECQPHSHGALLFLPHGSHSEDVLRTKVFEGYIKGNVDSWLRWSRRGGFPIDRMDDLILVTGCTLTTSWAAAVFDNSKASMPGSFPAAISLDLQKPNRGGGQFFWHNSRGNVDYHNSHFDPTVEGPLPRNQCVFFRGFRARRIFFFRTKPMRAAAEPLPDDPDNRRDDEIQVTRIPDGSKEYQYRDPLVVILDYIEEKCQEDTMAKDIEDIIAIAHDDDLQLFEDIEIVTADAIESFLREKNMPLLIENGVAILHRFPISIDDRAEPPAVGYSNSAPHEELPPNAGAVFGTTLLNAVRKQYPSSQEAQGDEKLEKARDLVTTEVRAVITKSDLEVIENKFKFAREMKERLKTKSGFQQLLLAREYLKVTIEVYRHVKYVSDRAYDRFPFQPQPVTSSETEDIYRTARSLYLCWLICKEAFPPSRTQDKWVVDAWNEACHRTGANPNLLRQDEEIKCDSMKLFTDVKTKIKHDVDSLYEFDTSRTSYSISRNLRRAQALLARTTFIYREFNIGGRPRYPYRHPIIQKVVNTTWFQNKDDIGVVFYDDFSPIPFEVIAVAVTAVECCIDEWSTGTYKESNWKEERYKNHYLSHLNSLRDLYTHGPHQEGKDLLRQIQGDLLKAAREHAGVPLHPTTGAGKLSTYAIDAAIEDDTPKYDSD